MTRLEGLVLVVDDDPDMRCVLRAVLNDHGFHVSEAATGGQAKAILGQQRPDLVLLDLGLPDISGLDFLAELAEAHEAPVIVISGRSGETDTVVGLDLGADDYITKPVRERELIARINKTLRQSRIAKVSSTMVFGSLSIDEDTRDVTVDGARVDLTPKEFDLLAFLARSPRRVFTRKQLLEQVWGSSPIWQNDSTVAEHIHRIRRKLCSEDRTRWIETLRGVGYRFVDRSDS